MTLAWRSDGPVDAPALVLLNSVGSTTEMWSPLVGALAEQFRVIRIDHRGHGPSPAALPGSPCAIADLGDDVLGVLDTLELDRVHLAGLSLGGMIGMWLAIHRPERIGRLALLCTSAYLAGPTWTARAHTVRTEGMSAIAASVVGRWITTSLAERDADLVRALRTMLCSVDAESYAQCCRAIDTMDLRADLGRISAPTLVIAAAQDAATPAAQHGKPIADAIVDARLHVLDPAAHLVTVEQSGAIARLLLDHFRGGATLSAGFARRRAVLGDDHVDRAVASSTPLTQPFQDFITRYAWGDIWTRTELSRRERSIATLATLVAIGAEHELVMHVRAARRNGMTDEQIVEVLMHCAVYAGVPRANRAIALARDTLADE